MEWAPKQVARLRALWARGVSAQEIAERLGGSVTKGAVLGKVRRLGLERAEPGQRKKASARPATRPKPSVGSSPRTKAAAKVASKAAAKGTMTPTSKRSPAVKADPARSAPTRPAPAARTARKPAPAATTAPSPSAQAVKAGPQAPEKRPKPETPSEKQTGFRILDLRHGQCRWPLGGFLDAPRFFCGAPTVGDSSWCAEHAAIALGRKPGTGEARSAA